jgi:YfiR/HmsC-like
MHRAPLPCCLLLSILSLAAISAAQEAHPTETQVKAAYLYNFGKFVKWQVDRVASPDSFEICILGKDPFGSVLDSTVAGERIDGRKITVRRISKIQQAEPCSILFISKSEENRLPPILLAAQHWSLLTVSDLPHFAEQGGDIAFVMHEDKIRFEVNRSAALQSHLLLSSELLKVATRVIGNVGPEN